MFSAYFCAIAMFVLLRLSKIRPAKPSDRRDCHFESTEKEGLVTVGPEIFLLLCGFKDYQPTDSPDFLKPFDSGVLSDLLSLVHCLVPACSTRRGASVISVKQYQHLTTRYRSGPIKECDGDAFYRGPPARHTSNI
jgi:hypothetical protein